jgi:type I restriction enzyme S subunit
MRKGWEIKNLGDVCEFQNGFAFKSNKYKDTGLPVLRITNIQNENLETRKIVFFDPSDYKENFEKYKVEYGDLVVAMSGATTGKIGINQTDTVFYLNQRVGKFIPRKNILKTYLFYFLSTNVEESLRISAGAAQPNLSTEQIKNFKIPIPPISEQQEIVAMIDDAFESIERAKSNAEQNLKNAKELFDSYLQNIFEKGNWAETTLEKLSNKKDSVVSGPFGSNLKVSDYKEKGVPILRLQNIGKGFFINKSIKFITKEKAEELKYHSFKSGDIVLAKLGIPIGKTCIIPESFEDGIITADVVRIRPDKNIVNYKFLEYFLNTNISVAQLTGNISGATRPRVNLSDVRNIKLALPKLQEQKDIVDELDNLTMKINKLEEILKRKISSLEELKKSILQKAFNGELKTSKISA